MAATLERQTFACIKSCLKMSKLQDASSCIEIAWWHYRGPSQESWQSKHKNDMHVQVLGQFLWKAVLKKKAWCNKAGQKNIVVSYNPTDPCPKPPTQKFFWEFWSKTAAIVTEIWSGGQNKKKCNLTLAMSPTCHCNNTLLLCWHDYRQTTDRLQTDYRQTESDA